MNKFIIIGNLARDPESKVMQNGKTRAMFTIAVNRPYTDANGQRGADYITCIAYDKTADLVAKYLSKGRKACVEGHIKTGSYDKEDGTKAYTTDFVAERVEFLSASTSQAQPEPAQQESAAQESADPYIDDGELPF